MTRLAVITSGGDAPGMNAAIRSVVRVGLANGYEMFGVRHGYTGLIAGDLVPLKSRDVGGILSRGGTMLGTTRCQTLTTPQGQHVAVEALRTRAIEGLIVIGGNGSQAGADALSQLGMPVVGVASTIDNDLPGTDISVGVATALDVAVEAIDKIRVTAASLRRAFLIEVMGRHSGYLALMAGLAGGAEAIVLPEVEISPSELADRLHANHTQGRSHAIVVVAEGSHQNADRLEAFFKSHPALAGFDVRTTKLGHVQRGGTPNVFDRVLATQLGAAAIDCFREGRHGVMVGLLNGRIATTELSLVATSRKVFDEDAFKLAGILAQ
jgi:6-phosphofructokinase 1